jgi:uracil phosphoribosyltransferase
MLPPAPQPRCSIPLVPLRLVDHPLVHDALVELRDARTGPPAFRRAANRISVLLAAEALRDVPSAETTVQTPLGPAAGRRVTADVVVVPVLRAGLGMLDAVLELLPAARVGHIGLQRDEATAIASKYYTKLPPDLAESYVLMICIVAAPEGLDLVERRHPDVFVYTPAVDRELNAHKFIVPGLGDFGDRLYGTV